MTLKRGIRKNNCCIAFHAFSRRLGELFGPKGEFLGDFQKMSAAAASNSIGLTQHAAPARSTRNAECVETQVRHVVGF